MRQERLNSQALPLLPVCDSPATSFLAFLIVEPALAGDALGERALHRIFAYERVMKRGARSSAASAALQRHFLRLYRMRASLDAGRKLMRRSFPRAKHFQALSCETCTVRPDHVH
jgi:hypothetical protein